MLLCFDIGNTNVKAAFFQGDEIIHEWRISTDAGRTVDEYFSIVNSLMASAGLKIEGVSSVAISSVVPSLKETFASLSEKFIGKKPLVVGPDMYSKLPVKITGERVKQIGTDLMCDAIAAWEKYKRSCVVANFGTALAFTVLDDTGEIIGAAIAPGIGTAMKSLFSNTAQLPSVPFEIPKSSLGKNTMEAIQVGVVLGYKGLVESLVMQMKEDLVRETGAVFSEIKTIATGGLSGVLLPITNVFDDEDKKLTLHGLRLAYEYGSR